MYQTEDHHTFHDIVASAHVLTAVEPQINVTIRDTHVLALSNQLVKPYRTNYCIWKASRDQMLFWMSLSFLAQLLHHAVRHRDGVLFVALVREADLASLDLDLDEHADLACSSIAGAIVLIAGGAVYQTASCAMPKISSGVSGKLSFSGTVVGIFFSRSLATNRIRKSCHSANFLLPHDVLIPHRDKHESSCEIRARFLCVAQYLCNARPSVLCPSGVMPHTSLACTHPANGQTSSTPHSACPLPSCAHHTDSWLSQRTDAH